MRIVIDMQGAQTEGHCDGMGRYVLSLAQALAGNRGQHEIILALSGLFPDAIQPIRAAFDGLLSQENIRVWYAPGPVKGRQPGNQRRREVARRIGEAFLASLRPDAVFIPGIIPDGQDSDAIRIGLSLPNVITATAIDGLDSSQADAEAKNLLKRFEELATASGQSLPSSLERRLRLAFVSPLPPQRSGISDYSAELLPELARFYDVDVIVAQAEISDPWIVANCGVRTVEWFLQNADQYERVMYHFGNSPFHQHMFDMLARVPGVVVLHDFFLGDVHWYREAHALSPYFWTRALYQSHGYNAVSERFRASDGHVVRQYPANLGVLQQALGVVVHSEHSRRLAREWYGKDFAAEWKVIPLLRTPGVSADRARIREALGLKADDLAVCSFGFISPYKLNRRLLDSWLGSRLAKDPRCVLVFVGENHGDEYGEQLKKSIRHSGLEKRIRITGWTDMPTFRNYLAAADIAVQLRTQSRGETSAAVLDCMNYALPTIANANGSMADLPADAVWMLPDEFENNQLAGALETLWQDKEKRASLGARAQEFIRARHAPRVCAEQYAEAIEQFYARSQSVACSLVKTIADTPGPSFEDAECQAIAQAIAQTLPPARALRQLLLDISATCRADLKTGIERTTRALLMALLASPPAGYRVEPVYLTDQGGFWHYRYARRYTLGLLGCPVDALGDDDVVESGNGDALLGLDLSGSMLVEAARAGVLAFYRNAGVTVRFMVYDLLPVRMPECFPPGADETHKKWLQAVAQGDGAICISKTVAEDFADWLKNNGLRQNDVFQIGWSHLGADVQNSAPTRGLPKNSDQVLARLGARRGFLLVGTIEPRKGYLQTIEAFTRLWQEGLDVNLVIVGKEGWKGFPENARRTIPEIVNRLRAHPELNKRLFWFEGISDEYLEKIYAASTCLIAASEGEGFGLPLIEAAQHKLPMIVRDIPVFREVAGEHAYYFQGFEPRLLADAVKQWLELDKQGKTPRSDNMPWLTWTQSAEQLMKVILGDRRQSAPTQSDPS